MDKCKYEEAKLAAMTSATVLYNLLEVFETEVKVQVPMTIIDMMAKRNGEYLRSVYGDDILERIKADLEAENEEALNNLPKSEE